MEKYNLNNKLNYIEDRIVYFFLSYKGIINLFIFIVIRYFLI